METDKDVIIYDAEIKNAAIYINNYCNALTELIESYNVNLTYVVNNAIKDQKIANKLSNIASHIGSLKGHLAEIAVETQNICSLYLTEIDNADQFLY